MYVPAPQTLLEGIHKLPAASWLRVSARAEPQVSEPVRSGAPPAPDPAAKPEAGGLGEREALMLESARLRTVSDVPIGVFLSGGVDSNVVLELLHRAGHRPLRTYTVGFEGLADERALARQGADLFSDEHTELVVETDLERDIGETLRHFGEPIADSATINTYLISREASKHVKVIVNGDGGDELFGGYSRFLFARRFDEVIRFPGGASLLDAYLAGRRESGQNEALQAYRHGGAEAAVRALHSIAHAGTMQRLLGEHRPEPWPVALPFDAGKGLTGAEFAWESGLYLPDDLLVKVDVASMACGLENRSPLLDHRLFEHVGRLPAARRASLHSQKWILRKLARGRIPDAVLDAPKKGFGLPLHEWLPGPLSGWLADLIGDAHTIAPAFKAGAIRREYEAFRQGDRDPYAAYRMWSLAVLEFWAREFSVEM
jgi:asparagine synthase (glutamine-hydrolysing)